MGNAISKKYDAPKEYTATAGHSQLFKIWPAKSKETGRELSVWVFDKTELAKKKVNTTSSSLDKAVVEQIYQIMKKDMTLLREICLSSGSSSGVGNVVQYLDTVEETTSVLIFTTEPILCSLADLMSGFEGILPSPRLEEMKKEYFSNESSSSLSSPSFCGLSDIEISRGILNISEGLQYFHIVQRKLHLNLTPESIVITQSGQWKLCGLGFALGFQQGERQQLPSPYFLQSLSNTHMMRLEPDLRYCGPELTTGGLNPPSIRYLTLAADVFSLGIIAYEAYRFNLDISSPDRKTAVIPMSNNSAVYHQAALDNITRLNYSFLPSTSLAQLIMDMIQLIPSARISIPNIINHPYFSSGPLQVLKLIDSLKTRDIGTQSSQLLTLPSQLTSLPVRLLEGTILPSICQATISNIVLLPYAIPTHIYISQKISKSKYCNIAGPSIIQAFENNTSIEVMQALLKNLIFFADIFTPEGKTNSRFTSLEPAVVNLISNCLDKSQTSVHIAGFRILCDDKIRQYITSQSIVNKIVPKVCREACKNSDPNVKIHALYVLSLISPRLDKGYIIQNILPSLKYITDHERNPVVSMCVLGNYSMIANILGAEYIAKNIIPTICPMLVDRSLDKKQFELVGHLFRMMLSKVYELRAADLGLSGTGSSNIFYKEDSGYDIDPFYAAKVMIQSGKKDEVYDSSSLPQQNELPNTISNGDYNTNFNHNSNSNININSSNNSSMSSSSRYLSNDDNDIYQPVGKLTKVGRKTTSDNSTSNPFDSVDNSKSNLVLPYPTTSQSTIYPQSNYQNIKSNPIQQQFAQLSIGSSSMNNSQSSQSFSQPTYGQTSYNGGLAVPQYSASSLPLNQQPYSMGIYGQAMNMNSSINQSSSSSNVLPQTKVSKKDEDPFDFLN